MGLLKEPNGGQTHETRPYGDRQKDGPLRNDISQGVSAGAMMDAGYFENAFHTPPLDAIVVFANGSPDRRHANGICRTNPFHKRFDRRRREHN
jgi:hypothetical protein